MAMKTLIPNVAIEALPIIAGFLKQHGVNVIFLNCGLRGTVECDSGMAVFEHDGDNILAVNVVRNEGHFSERMLRGGIRQLVSEAMERVMAEK